MTTTNESATPSRRLGRCVMYLLDGRILELTGLTVDEVCAMLNELQITPADVASTVHYCNVVVPRVH
jgi:hypothetical protein